MPCPFKGKRLQPLQAFRSERRRRCRHDDLLHRLEESGQLGHAGREIRQPLRPPEHLIGVAHHAGPSQLSDRVHDFAR
jgi:hypothetical protein